MIQRVLIFSLLIGVSFGYPQSSDGEYSDTASGDTETDQYAESPAEGDSDDVQVETYIVQKRQAPVTEEPTTTLSPSTAKPTFSISDLIDRAEQNIVQSALNVGSVFHAKKNPTEDKTAGTTEKDPEASTTPSDLHKISKRSPADAATSTSTSTTRPTITTTESFTKLIEGSTTNKVPASHDRPSYIAIDRVAVYQSSSAQLPILPLFRDLSSTTPTKTASPTTQEGQATTIKTTTVKTISSTDQKSQ